MRENSATEHPDLSTVPLPAGVETAGDWDLDGYRDLYGFDRTITDHQIRVYALGSQNTSGTIFSGMVILADGEDRGPEVDSDQARELAAALLEAAAEVDRWAAR
jgi:hypothetical protein